MLLLQSSHKSVVQVGMGWGHGLKSIVHFIFLERNFPQRATAASHTSCYPPLTAEEEGKSLYGGQSATVGCRRSVSAHSTPDDGSFCTGLAL